MRTIRTKIYKFEELSEDAQQTAIDKMREINVNYDSWHDGILEGCKEKLDEVGFLNSEIWYTGFHSQGDGLCFDAKIDVSKFATTPNEKRVVKLIDAGLIENPSILKTSFANHYSHENTRFVDYDTTDKKNIDEALKDICYTIELNRIALCKDFYNTLYKDYEYLQSDEVVKETILANEYEFTKDGNIF